MLFRAYVSRWLAQVARRYRRNTLIGYRTVLVLHVLPSLGDRPLEAIGFHEVRALLARLLGEGYADNTVRMVRTALSAVFTDARLDQLIPANPIEGVCARLWLARDERQPPVFTPEELDRFFAACVCAEARHERMFWVMVRTGVRLGEALALDAASVRPDIAGLHVAQTYHGHGRFGPTKSGRARLVDCSDLVIRELVELAARGGPLFLNPRTRQPYHPGSVQDAFGRVIASTGLPAHLTPHALRHTFASTHLALGAPVQWVQQQLGHAHISTTVGTYGSWLQARRHDLANQLDREVTRHGVRRAEQGGDHGGRFRRIA